MSVLTHEPYAHTDAYWVGKLSATIGVALESLRFDLPREAERRLRSALKEFLASPLPSEELRGVLRKYLK